MALSACVWETRSTTEVPLVDETTNTPTAFNDKLVGSDDLDTFTALAGDDEIYGFVEMTKLLLEQEMISYMVVMAMIIFNLATVMIKFTVRLEMIHLFSAGADIEDGEGTDTIIFGPDQTTLPVTINLDTGRYHFTS